MSRFVAVVALFAFVALARCEDCSKAIETLHDCFKSSDDKNKDDHEADHKKMETDIKTCFTKSGCKEPTFDNKDDKAKEAKEEDCRKPVHDKAHKLIATCVQKKTGVTLPEKKADGKWGKGKGKGKGKGRFEEDLKTLCSNDEQRNDTRKCLRDMHDKKKGDKDARRAEAEKRFNARCDNKKTCFAKLSTECQKKVNETKAAVCECAKSELTGKAATDLNDAMKKCGDDKDHGDKSNHGHDHDKAPMTFTEHITKKICSMSGEDRCSKPFKGSGSGSKEGKGKGSGSGSKEGKGKGKGRGGESDGKDDKDKDEKKDDK